MQIEIKITDDDGKTYTNKFDDEEEYIYCIKHAVKNGHDPTETMEYLLRLGSRQVNNPLYKIGVENYITGNRK